MRKGENKRQAILDVAEKLFYAKGYEATSVQDIIDVLGTSKGSLYHHFESKETLLTTLCAQKAEDAAQRAQQAAEGESEPLARLGVLLMHMLPAAKEDRRFLVLLLPLTEKAEGAAVCAGYDAAVRQAFTPLLQEQLDACVKADVIGVPDNPFLAELVACMMCELWHKMAAQTLHDLHQGENLEVGTLLDVVNLYRYALEGILNAPLGSLLLVDLEEAAESLQAVMNHLKIA